MSNIRIVLFDHLYRTKDWSLLGLRDMAQYDLDKWLGSGTVRLDVQRPEDRASVISILNGVNPPSCLQSLLPFKATSDS